MHQITLATVALAALVAVAAATLLIGRAPAPAQAASSSFNIMQMMKDARDLPAQQYDAF